MPKYLSHSQGANCQSQQGRSIYGGRIRNLSEKGPEVLIQKESAEQAVRAIVKKFGRAVEILGN